MTRIPACADFEARLPAFAAGNLTEAEEDALRVHLSQCGACAARAAAVDPSVLFLRLRREPLPDGFWTGFDRELHARVRAEASRPAFLRALAAAPRLAWAAPGLMVLVLGVSLFVTGPARLGIPGLSRPTPARPPYARPHRDRPRLERPSDRPSAFPTGAPPGVPAMEGVASPGARVYRFSVGGPGDETPVYFVVDEGIDL
ncbi:MAG: zf-HC2 domain-containing protein [Candidatus Polarisedimenticolia bacterium]